jgi:subtilase family serine protease
LVAQNKINAEAEDNQETQRLCGFIHFPEIKEDLTLDDQKKGLKFILNYIKY